MWADEAVQEYWTSRNNCHQSPPFSRPREQKKRRISEAPLEGALSCNFLTKYLVSHKFRLQISQKLKYRPVFICYLLRYIYDTRSLALKSKLEKYRFQVAYCDSCLNCCYSKSDGRYQVESKQTNVATKITFVYQLILLAYLMPLISTYRLIPKSFLILLLY